MFWTVVGAADAWPRTAWLPDRPVKEQKYTARSLSALSGPHVWDCGAAQSNERSGSVETRPEQPFTGVMLQAGRRQVTDWV